MRVPWMSPARDGRLAIAATVLVLAAVGLGYVVAQGGWQVAVVPASAGALVVVGLSRVGLLRNRWGVQGPSRGENAATPVASVPAPESPRLEEVSTPTFDREDQRTSLVRAGDAADRTRLHARLKQMDRLAAIAPLAAGVGHDINNPLTYVVANLEYLAERLDGIDLVSAPKARLALRDEAKKVLEEALQGAWRIRQVVAELRRFALVDTGPRETGEADLGLILEFAAKMVRCDLREEITLTTDLRHAARVKGDANGLLQVFLNLLANAADAVADREAGASITVSARAAPERVLVEIRDTGRGIAPEHLSHIFEPCFSTKPSEQAAGLGLSVALDLVERCGGAIHVESTAGQGACFTVELRTAPPGQPGPRPKPVGPCATRRGRVLVVDDEPQVAGIVARALGDHDVVAAASVAEALQLISTDEAFDAILCDVMMPDVCGTELVAELARRFPNQASRTIFLTGGAFTKKTRDRLRCLPNQTLSKPFDLDALRGAVAQMVGPEKSEREKAER